MLNNYCQFAFLNFTYQVRLREIYNIELIYCPNFVTGVILYLKSYIMVVFVLVYLLLIHFLHKIVMKQNKI